MDRKETGKKTARSGRLTPDRVRALWESGEVSAAQTLPWGQVLDCVAPARQATEEELEERRETVLRTAARLLWTCNPPPVTAPGTPAAGPGERPAAPSPSAAPESE